MHHESWIEAETITKLKREEEKASNREAQHRHYEKNREAILKANRMENLSPEEQEKRRAKNREYAKSRRERVKATNPNTPKQKPGPKVRFTPEERKSNDLASRRRRYAEGKADRDVERELAAKLKKRAKLEQQLADLNQSLGDI